MQEPQRVQKLMNNFSAMTLLLIYIHQLSPGAPHAHFRTAPRTLGNVNIILIVRRRPWNKSYTRAIADVVHGLVNC